MTNTMSISQNSQIKLETIPPELLIIIFGKLDFRSLLQLRQTSYKLHQQVINLSQCFSGDLECRVPKIKKGVHVYKLLCAVDDDDRNRRYCVLFTFRVICSMFNGYSRINCKFISFSKVSRERLNIILKESDTFKVIQSFRSIATNINHVWLNIPETLSPPIDIDLISMLKSGNLISRLIDGFGIISNIPPIWEAFALNLDSVSRAILSYNHFQLDDDGIFKCENWICGMTEF